MKNRLLLPSLTISLLIFPATAAAGSPALHDTLPISTEGPSATAATPEPTTSIQPCNQERPTATTGSPERNTATAANSEQAVANTRTRTVTALGDFSYNTTYGFSAGLDLIGDIPIGPRFDCEPALQFTTAGVHTAAVQARTLFPIGRSILYLKNRIAFKDVARSDMYDACLGLSLGWTRSHVDIEAGIFGRVMDQFGRDIHSLDAAMCEPFNLLYSIKGLLRNDSSPWNAWLALSNVDIFQFERMWQPIISAGGFYDLNERITLRMEAVYKAAGMFHLNAEFYSISARAGVSIRF